MTQDEIIEMARQADMLYRENVDELHSYLTDGVYLEDLEAFAKLIEERTAAKEREACLKIAESMSLTDANMNKTWRTGCRDVAEAIRARGEA